MAEWHIGEDLFERFLQTEASSEEGREIMKHLLSGCARCSELVCRITAELGFWKGTKARGRVGWEQAYEEVFRRALAFASEQEQRLAVEKLRGWAQWAQLEPLSPQLRFVMVDADKSFHTWGLYDRLLEASRWYTRTDPSEAVDIVRLAIVVAERLPEEIGERCLADLQASAWAELGNAHRLASDFEGARRAFNDAWRILEKGTGDPSEEGHLLSLEASFLKDIGEFETAESVLEEALENYRRAGDTHQQGRIFLQMGEVIGHLDPERGLAHIKKALTFLDATKEPRLALCAEHDLAWYLNDSGKSEEALAVLDRARPLYRQFPDKWTQLRLHWLEGRIAYRIEEYAQAESIFSQVWEEFRTRDLNHELVLVSIDLAQALTKKGELARAAELSAECFSIMSKWELHTDALAAWIVFQDALTEGTVRGDLFREMERYFRRHWFMPAKFAPDS